MALHLRLPAHPANHVWRPLPRPRTWTWLIGAGTTLLLGGAIAVFASELTTPDTSPPVVVTRGLDAPPPAVVGGTDPTPPIELPTAVQAPVITLSADGRLGLAVEFVPAQVRAGSPLVMRFSIQNRSSGTLARAQIDAEGPWDGYAVVEVTPAGSFERVSNSQATIRSQINLAANTTGVVSLLAFPSQAGDAQFSFDLRQPETE
jgi:hypothetical protein